MHYTFCYYYYYFQLCACIEEDAVRVYAEAAQQTAADELAAAAVALIRKYMAA